MRDGKQPIRARAPGGATLPLPLPLPQARRVGGGTAQYLHPTRGEPSTAGSYLLPDGPGGPDAPPHAHSHSPRGDRDGDGNGGAWLWPRQCVQCDGEAPSCNCAADENCVLTGRTCSQCPTIQCNKKGGGGGDGVNPGVIAGPVVAVLVIASICLFWWLRRKKRRDLARLEQLAERARKAESAGFALSSHPGSPGPGSARSARSNRSRASNLQLHPHTPHTPHSAQPLSAGLGGSRGRRSPLPPAAIQGEYYDSTGDKVRVYAGNGTINLDPAHPDNGGLGPGSGSGGGSGDPFADNQSVSTRGSGATGQSGGTNIIPIQYVASRSDGASDSTSGILAHAHAHAQGQSQMRGDPTQAARTLNEARENLFRAAPGVPQRPARAPGLDLRLDPAAAERELSERERERSPAAHGGHAGQGHGQSRESFLSGTSGAPSFLSGYTADLHLDAPKIVTSRQVHVGRLHQAEVVHFGAGGPVSSSLLGTMGVPAHAQEQGMYQGGWTEGAPISPALSAVRTPLPATSSAGSGPGGAGEFDDAEQEQVPSPGDLRFSMGSLAYRDSVSTMGTSRYLAGASAAAAPRSPVAPPRSGGGFAFGQERESMMSARSDSSGLSAFPMIPPGAEIASALSHAQRTAGAGIPQSTSVSTLDHAQLARPDVGVGVGAGAGAVPPPSAGGKPPSSFKMAGQRRGPGTGTGIGSGPPADSRPQTTVSVADSLLGSFPFMHPGSGSGSGSGHAQDQDQGQGQGGEVEMMPGPHDPHDHGGETTRRADGGMTRRGAGDKSRYTGMSVASEGLGGFEFRFGEDEEVPEVPEVPRRRG